MLCNLHEAWADKHNTACDLLTASVFCVWGCVCVCDFYEQNNYLLGSGPHLLFFVLDIKLYLKNCVSITVLFSKMLILIWLEWSFSMSQSKTAMASLMCLLQCYLGCSHLKVGPFHVIQIQLAWIKGVKLEVQSGLSFSFNASIGRSCLSPRWSSGILGLKRLETTAVDRSSSSVCWIYLYCYSSRAVIFRPAH